MSDSVELRVGEQVVQDFRSYSVESGIYAAAAAFRCDVTGCTADLRAGDRCELRIAGQLVMTGVIDVVTKGWQRGASPFVVQGRDLMGVVVDSYCTTWRTLSGRTLEQVAESLIRGLPLVGRVRIEYDTAAQRRESAQTYRQIEPGQTVFDVLRQMALSRGLVFYCRPDGTLVFRKPAGRGDYRFALTVTDGENWSDILSAEHTIDVSQRYRNIHVVGQQQGSSDDGPADINVHAVVSDADAPLDKDLVVVYDGDSQGPAAMGRSALEQQRARSERYTYTVSGHTQNGLVWGSDELVAVWDERLGVRETLLTYGVVLTGSKGRQETRLELGPVGMVQ